jgi:HD-like signal output (HDOD) protein
VDSKHLEEYFIAGLLHDIGKIPLNNVLADEYIDVMARSDADRIPIVEAEEQYFGFDHVEAGSMIAETWHLQEAFVDAIRYHHHPEQYDGEAADIVLCVAAADYFMNIAEVGFSGNRYPQAPADRVFEKLGINSDFIDEIEDEVHEEIERAEIFLKVAE